MTLTATTKKHAIPVERTQSGLGIAFAAAARTAGRDFIVRPVLAGVGGYDADAALPGHFRALGGRFNGN